MRPELRERLEALIEAVDVPARLASDPVCFVHRYPEPADQEVAAVIASTLAYGRVAAFFPVLERLFALADAAGGPRAWVEGFEPGRDGEVLRPMGYRWNRGIDWILLLSALQGAYRRVDTLEALLPEQLPLPEALSALVDVLRTEAVGASAAAGIDADAFAQLPRGLRTFLPRPADGSATKRWWMLLRWLIRRPTLGIDLGLWQTRQPAELIVPLDTHVLRISRFLGLTERSDGSLRTAREVTRQLARLDPVDPVRYDFAIAHLGISGGCRGHRDPEVCVACPLDPVCAAG